MTDQERHPIGGQEGHPISQQEGRPTRAASNGNPAGGLPSLAGLTRIELARLSARNLVRTLLIALVGGLVVVAVITAVHSNRNLAAAHARAAAEARSVEGLQPPASVVKAACEKEVKAGKLPRGSCNSRPVQVGPPASYFYQDPRLFFATSVGRRIEGATIAVGLLAFLVGASAVGAEWGAGTFTSLLTFEPRRLRTLFSKAAAVVVGAVVVVLLAQAFEVGATAATAATRGSMAGTTAHVLVEALWTALRGVGLVAFLAVAGAAVAGITRSTAATVGILAAYLIGVEVFVVRFVPGLQRWTLATAASALLGGRATIVPTPPVGVAVTCVGTHCAGGGPPTHLVVVSATRGGLELAIVSLALLALWGLTLVRRDAA